MSGAELLGCPACGSVNLQENQSRATWQTFTLRADGDQNYEEFEWSSDDVRVESYECADCGEELDLQWRHSRGPVLKLTVRAQMVKDLEFVRALAETEGQQDRRRLAGVVERLERIAQDHTNGV